MLPKSVKAISVEDHIIESTYGHDAFLLEEAAQTAYIRPFLAETRRMVQENRVPWETT